jgi:hypothetical protein
MSYWPVICRQSKTILARRVYLVGSLNRMNSNGSGDVLLSDTKDISPIAALALSSAGVMAVRTESRLSDFTIMLKLTEGSSAVPYSLWGNARNNPAILRAWDRFSQFMTVTRKTFDGVEFIEACRNRRCPCCRIIYCPAIRNDSSAILSGGPGMSDWLSGASCLTFNLS